MRGHRGRVDRTESGRQCVGNANNVERQPERRHVRQTIRQRRHRRRRGHRHARACPLERLNAANKRAGTEFTSLIQTGQLLHHDDAKHLHSYNVDGYDRYSVKIIVDDVPFEGQKAIALNGDKAMFYDIAGVKEKEAA